MYINIISKFKLSSKIRITNYTHCAYCFLSLVDRTSSWNMGLMASICVVYYQLPAMLSSDKQAIERGLLTTFTHMESVQKKLDFLLY